MVPDDRERPAAFYLFGCAGIRTPGTRAKSGLFGNPEILGSGHGLPLASRTGRTACFRRLFLVAVLHNGRVAFAAKFASSNTLLSPYIAGHLPLELALFSSGLLGMTSLNLGTVRSDRSPWRRSPSFAALTSIYAAAALKLSSDTSKVSSTRLRFSSVFVPRSYTSR